VFYQAVLLLGYLYAHVLTRLTPRKQALFHSVVLILPLLVLPISAMRAGAPPAERTRFPWLLALLLSAVGLPFFVLSTSGSILQRWFGRVGHGSSRDPYFLYAASNLGSMLGLLAYPFVIEPNLRLKMQSLGWSAGYIVVALLTLACAWLALKPGTDEAAVRRWSNRSPAPEDIRGAGGCRWVLWAFVPSSLLDGCDDAPDVRRGILSAAVGDAARALPPDVHDRVRPAAVGAGARCSCAPTRCSSSCSRWRWPARANEPFLFILALDLSFLVLSGTALSTGSCPTTGRTRRT
jgi:hypothetical protein